VKIAIVGPAHPYTGGSTQHTTELAHRLSAAGHQVSLQSWSSQYPRLLYPGQPRVDESEALLRRCDAVLVHSPEEAGVAASLADTPAEVAALPLHLPRVGREAARVPGPARHRLSFFGIVRRYKGLDLLLRALASTKPEISVTVAGEIWYDRDELLNLISELQLGDRVTLSDRYVAAAEVPGYFADADALVLPYRSGTASQNALVALEFGIPVIATRAGAIAAAVSDGVNGILCTPGDVPELTRAINRLYEPGVLEQLQRGVRAPDTEPAWDRYIAAVERASSCRRRR
jgi:Glycosyl transferases group 1